MPASVNRTIALCAGQEYAPFLVNGDAITIYGEGARVRAAPRGFGITARGSNIAIIGVSVSAATASEDLNTWLCMYDSCNFKNWSGRGGVGYGGGILLDHTTNAAVANATVSGGTIGVASWGGANNKIVNNNLSNLNGWGVLLIATNQNYIVGNTLNDVNRACITPDGDYLQSGCESSGLAAIRAQANIIASNHCERAANCFYAAGDGGHSSNNNKFFNNYCAAAANNCFEVTFSQGNQFDYNTATEKCDYPFWISGSRVSIGTHNKWNCSHSANKAFDDSRQATNAPTQME